MEQPSNPFLDEKTRQKCRELARLIKNRFESNQNFAYAIGTSDSFVSKVLNGYRFLKHEQKMIWREALGTDLSAFPDPPTFKRNDDICPYYSLEEAE